MLSASSASLVGRQLRTALVSNISALLSTLIVLTAVTPLASPAALTVAAAADLAPAHTDIASSFQKLTGHSLKFVTGASGMLARQIENGAPFDLFLSANKAYVLDLARNGHVQPESVAVYALGRLGVWIPALRDADLKALVQVKRIAIANPKHAPYGAAAQQAMERAGIWNQVKDRLVLGENVRQALQYGESGNVDAVVTAWSLVSLKGASLVPQQLHEPIEQAAGILASTKQSEAARRFLDFLRSREGGKILERHGLTPVRGRAK